MAGVSMVSAAETFAGEGFCSFVFVPWLLVRLAGVPPVQRVRSGRYDGAMKTAVLVIDVQRGLCDDPPRPHEAEAVMQRINALTGRARASGVPVAFIQQ